MYPPASRERFVSAILICIAMGTVALLGVPRAVPPDDVPTPPIERRLLAEQLREEEALAREALSGLPFAVRAVGELVRRVGRAEAAGDFEEAAARRGELLEATRSAAREHGGRPLLSLRALQASLFLQELGSWEASGTASPDLEELGGAFLDQAARAGWTERGRLLASDEELGAVFRMRWTELTGLSEAAAFIPRLNDSRLFYSLRLRLRGPAGGSARLEEQLAAVRALSRLDATYPASYAEGVLLYRSGALAEALERFRAHLRASPDGPYALRARNYATACAEALLGESASGE